MELRGGCLSKDDLDRAKDMLTGKIVEAPMWQRNLLRTLLATKRQREVDGISSNSLAGAALDRRIQEVVWFAFNETSSADDEDILPGYTLARWLGYDETQGGKPKSASEQSELLKPILAKAAKAAEAAAASGVPPIPPRNLTVAEAFNEIKPKSVPSLIAHCFNSEVLHRPDRFDPLLSTQNNYVCNPVRDPATRKDSPNQFHLSVQEAIDRCPLKFKNAADKAAMQAYLQQLAATQQKSEEEVKNVPSIAVNFRVLKEFTAEDLGGEKIQPLTFEQFDELRKYREGVFKQSPEATSTPQGTPSRPLAARTGSSSASVFSSLYPSPRPSLFPKSFPFPKAAGASNVTEVDGNGRGEALTSGPFQLPPVTKRITSSERVAEFKKP